MENNIELNREKINGWARVMAGHELPAWDELPTLELYMDQVVVLISQYLSYLGTMLNEDKPVTPAMINNYVKMGLVPPPVKKRYNRTHLASLIMICVLKRSLAMSAIQLLLRPDMPEEELRALYELFRVNRRRGIDYVAQQAFDWNGAIFGEPDGDGPGLVVRLAVMASLLKIAAEKLVAGEEGQNRPKGKKDA